MSDAHNHLEQQLFTMLRRTNAIHLEISDGDMALERSSYWILRLIAAEGPQRLGAVADAFRLDPSTITRQAQTLVRLGLAEKKPDPEDGRAAILGLSELGRTTVSTARATRLRILGELLSDWSDEDMSEFLAYLSRFNATVDAWLEHVDTDD